MSRSCMHRGLGDQLRWIVARAALLVVLVLVAACGGGGGGGGEGGGEGGGGSGADVGASPGTVDVDLAACPVATASPEEIVLCNNAPALLTEGAFEAVDGYLSASPKVLRSAGPQPASARFAPGIDKRGHYEVYAWWPQAGQAGSAAEIMVEHRGGATVSIVDQTAFGGQWNSLGTFPFDPLQQLSITLRKVASAPLLVDAIRLRFVGELPPDPMFATTALPLGDEGEPYSARLEVTGGQAPYSFAAATALPPGLLLDAQSGSISGTPSVPGNFDIEFEVADATGIRVTTILTLIISEADRAELPVEEPPPAGGGGAQLEDSPGPDNLSGLRSIVAAMPEGGWRQVNLNRFSDAWAPASLRPLLGAGNPEPKKIIAAWSSFAWDSNRGNLLLYGGGHANYRGNEVYIWHGSTRKWTRGSLPSEVRRVGSASWNPVDGADKAPASAHTYDNNVFLPILDRFLTFGGAAEWEGSQYKVFDSQAGTRNTGPYLFDPARAHPDKVGGSTGSHVVRVAPHPEVLGGNMWSNRENYLNASKPPPNSFADGCTAYATEGGKDVVYVYTKQQALYRYTIHSLGDRTRDTWETVGVFWGGPGSKTTCAYDPVRRIFVRTATNGTPFVYWDLNTASPGNRDVRMIPSDPSGRFPALMASSVEIRDCGFDFDRPRNRFALWCGGGAVWMLTPPATLSPSGWIIRRQPTPSGAVPSTYVGTGILGKWKYIPNLDVFMALQGSVQGNVWIYKPVGWQAP